jgi:phosphate transport system permease protein
MNKSLRNRIVDESFKWFGVACTLFGLVMLAIFLSGIINDGIHRINWEFLTNFTSRRAEKAGVYPAILGTLWILALTFVIAIPIGIAAGIYLEEYGKRNHLASIIEVNIANLAGVPSVIYGLLGLEIFCRILGMGSSVLAGACTLSLLILPVIIVSTREALKAVPHSLREASFGLGASKWQTIWFQVLPASAGGIVTGVILSLSRAIGETAPLIVVGAATMVTHAPTSPTAKYTVLPIQIFNWISRPEKDFLINGAAGIIVLLAITFIMNGIALYLRNKWQKRVKW